MSAARTRTSLALIAKLFRGLGDPSRLQVLAVLRDGRLSAGEIATRTGLSQPNTSMHLKCLGECGLVTWEREGRFMRYQIADKRVVKLLGMVNAVPEFEDHPKVINGCSDLFVEVLGEAGKHARSAVGVGSLPMGIPVEIECIVEVS